MPWLGQLGQVLRRAAGQDAAVDRRVQRLHAAPRISGKPVIWSTWVTGQPCGAQCPRGAAGRDQLEAQLGQAAGEFDQAGLVVDAQDSTSVHCLDTPSPIISR